MDANTSHDHDLDLPLSANITDVEISHFLLHLTCDLEQKSLCGDITLFCRTVKGGNQSHNSKDCNSHKHIGADSNQQNESNPRFPSVKQDNKADLPPSSSTVEQMGLSHVEPQSRKLPDSECVQDIDNVELPVIILDSHALDVSCVEEMVLLPEMERKLSSAGRGDVESANGVYMQCYSQARTRPLAYNVSEHSIKIWREHLESGSKLSVNKASFILSGECEKISDTVDKCEREVIQEHGDVEDHQYRSSSASIAHKSVLDKHGKAVVSHMGGSEGRTDNGSEDGTDNGSEGGTDNGSEGRTDNGTEGGRKNAMVGEIPRVVKIHYSTKPNGPSLKWTLDQDGRPCMFTIGHWLNNRSWFPSQDAPSAMPTWQATVTVVDNLTVLMSGDQASLPTSSHGHVSFYYYTTMPMPTSTLAIAVGSWKQINVTQANDQDIVSPPPCHFHGSTCIVNYSPKPDLLCRVFATECLTSVIRKELSVYIPKCLREVYSILGHHPFQRLDVLIVPQCFDSLGMASPSLLLLSQSLLVGDSSMCARVAHEICHSWFGLLIGPCDWTEEWLTEGFCTYLEDIMHARVCQLDEDEMSDHLELRALLKKRTLVSEVENTEEDLQTLRPNQGEQLLSDSGSVQYVKNGMNPDKGFMQVHYLKGFFLLRHLQMKVGLTPFLDFLHQYVLHFHAQLVTSQDFLDFFFQTFPHLKQDEGNETLLVSQWLDCPGLPEDVKQFTPRSTNHLWNKVKLQVSEIQSYCMRTTTKQRKKRLKTDFSVTLEPLHTDQLVLLLEDLLLLDHIPHQVLDILLHTYQLSTANPEVRHRWCELIVKHHHKSCYKDVQHFLINDQAMGVYLYGEMVLSGCKRQKELALKCFQITGSDMPPGTHKIVKSMLYGT